MQLLLKILLDMSALSSVRTLLPTQQQRKNFMTALRKSRIWLKWIMQRSQVGALCCLGLKIVTGSSLLLINFGYHEFRFKACTVRQQPQIFLCCDQLKLVLPSCITFMQSHHITKGWDQDLLVQKTKPLTLKYEYNNNYLYILGKYLYVPNLV